MANGVLAEPIRRRRDEILAGWEAGVRTLAGGAQPRPALVNRVPASPVPERAAGAP